MLCENCHENEANIRYTQIINGAKKEMNLCDECAHKLGIGGINFNMPIDFSNFFGDLLNEYEDSGFMPTLAIPKVQKCEKCGLTFEDFIETGKFGCDNCYQVFEQRIDPILKRLHGNNNYVGRSVKNLSAKNDIPKQKSKTNEKAERIEELKKELKQRIKEEQYEEAAKIRDEIKKLEK